MALLINKTKNKVLISDLKRAEEFKSRAVGLIGQKQLSSSQGMFFPQCNWIHTFFMSMTIDVIYVDKNMSVKKIQRNLKPWRLPLPALNASHVIETGQGAISEDDIQIGDQLNVGH